MPARRPAAGLLHRDAGGSRKALFIILLVIPFWTSFLIRTYAGSSSSGPTGSPVGSPDTTGNRTFRILGTEAAVLLGLVYGYLPLMVFPLYVTLERIDRTLVEASKDLGPARWATFRQITLPIALPGLITGSILVFIPMMGEYVIPEILGYGRVFTDRQLAGAALLRRAQLAGGLGAGRRPDPRDDDQRHVLPVVHQPWPPGARRERPVTAPSVPIPAARTLGGRARAGTDRFGRLVEAWLRGHTALVYLFLYIPIVIVVVFSFNATERRVTDWDGFSLRWYEYVFGNREVQRYLPNSLIVGFFDRGRLDDRRHDGGARPAARAEVVPPAVRRR